VVSGNEVLRGRVRDANGPALADDLERRGVAVTGIMQVPDRFNLLVEALRAPIAAGAALVIVTGGLGPTHDDLTMAAVAEAAGVRLVVDPAARAMVEERTRGRGPNRRDDANLLDKQGAIPEGALVLTPAGTAPGAVLATATAVLVALPGPPWERAEVWERALASPPVAAVLARTSSLPERTLRITAVPESRFADALLRAPAPARARVEVGVCARDGDLEVTMRGPEGEMDALHGALTREIGPAIYTDDGRSLEEVVAAGLVARGARLALAESCTGGIIAAGLTELAGASRWFAGGVVAYEDAVKRDVLGVPEDVLVGEGAVSEATAGAMAVGARAALNVDWGLSVTGIAGPGGGRQDKPVGLVYLGCATPDGRVVVARHQFGGDRGRVRARARVAALHLLRRVLDD